MQYRLSVSALHGGSLGRRTKGRLLASGDLGSSAFLSSAIGNWRVPACLEVGWLTGDLEQGQNLLNCLSNQVRQAQSQGQIGNAGITTKGIKEIQAHCAQNGFSGLAILHLADPPNADILFQALQELTNLMMPQGLILISGEQTVMNAIHTAIIDKINPAFLRRIETLTINADGSDRKDVLIALPMNAPPLPYLHLGAIYDQQYAALGKTVSGLRSLTDMPVLPRLDTNAEGVWSAQDGSAMRSAHCFAAQDMKPQAPLYSQNYNDFTSDVAKDKDVSQTRWSRAFGRVVSLPAGSIVGHVPISASGMIPLECVNPYHLKSKGLAYRNSPRSFLPVTELPGEWIWMPAPGSAPSHWYIENFLPALVMAEIGVAPNVICSTPPCDYQKLYMELAGFSPERCVVAEKNRAYRCERLLVAAQEPTEHKIRSWVNLHHPSANRRIEALLARAGITKRSLREKIYVSRLDCRTYRGCLNEEAVIEHVSRRGYRVVNGSSLSPLEALQVYGNARVIVGPLGAGLANSIFAPQGCQIISFMAPEYFEEHIEQLSHLVGMDYAYLGCSVFQSDDPYEGGARNSNFIVDIDKLNVLLDLAEARSAARTT